MEQYAWFRPTMERLMDMMRYPDKANEFGCSKVAESVVREAIRIVSRYMGEHTPAPRIVPTLEGGLILEFLEYWVDLTVEIKLSGGPIVKLSGDPEFLKSHGYEPETVPGMFFEKTLKDGIDCLEILRKKGPPNGSKKSDDRGAPQASAPAGS